MSKPPPASGPPLSDSATDPHTNFDAVPTWARYTGCGCLFVPGGLFALALALILSMARGLSAGAPPPSEPEHPLRALAALTLAVLCAVFGALWVRGHPRRTLGAGRLILGVILLLVAARWGLSGRSVGLALALTGVGLALTLWAYLGDRPREP